MKTLISFLFLTATLAQAQEVICKNDASECAMYCQLSDRLQCSGNNYLTQFGHKYCRKFLDHADRFSKHGQLILSRIRSCLTTELRHRNHLTCKTVEDFALESHYSCYIKSGFCDLSPQDALDVMWIIRSQFFNTKMQPYFSRVHETCQFRFRQSLR